MRHDLPALLHVRLDEVDDADDDGAATQTHGGVETGADAVETLGLRVLNGCAVGFDGSC